MKAEMHCTCLTVGITPIDYPSNFRTPTADLTTCKVLLNSTISTPGELLMTSDIKSFYLNTLLEHYEYIRLALNLMPE